MQLSSTILFSVLASLSSIASAAPVDKRDAKSLKIDFSVERLPSDAQSTGQRKSVYSAVNLNLQNEYSKYMAEIQIGSPGQTIHVDVDTGSSDLWVPAVGTKSTGGTYDASKSSSYKKVSNGFMIGYGDGSKAFGDWATEDVTVGGATVKDMQFGYATNQTVGTGLLGVGFEGNEAPVAINGSSFEYPNFPAQLKAQGIIEKNAYSLYLNSLEADSGSILFGAVDKAKFDGDLKYLDLVNIDDEGQATDSPVAFFVDLDTVSTSSQTFTNGTTYPALLDSGTTLIYAPGEIATTFGKKYGHKVPFVDMYFTSCNTVGEPVEFTFGDKIITVPFKDLLYHFNGKASKSFLNQCLIGLVPNPSNYYILGDGFLRSAYVSYDLDDKKVGIAQVKYTDESEIELIQ